MSKGKLATVQEIKRAFMALREITKGEQSVSIKQRIDDFGNPVGMSTMSTMITVFRRGYSVEKENEDPCWQCVEPTLEQAMKKATEFARKEFV